LHSRPTTRTTGGGALVWRDAGVMLGTLYLCAAALKLESCIIGTRGVVQMPRTLSFIADIGVLALGTNLSSRDHHGV
jgi:hypothetical protein